MGCPLAATKLVAGLGSLVESAAFAGRCWSCSSSGGGQLRVFAARGRPLEAALLPEERKYTRPCESAPAFCCSTAFASRALTSRWPRCCRPLLDLPQGCPSGWRTVAGHSRLSPVRRPLSVVGPWEVCGWVEVGRRSPLTLVGAGNFLLVARSRRSRVRPLGPGRFHRRNSGRP